MRSSFEYRRPHRMRTAGLPTAALVTAAALWGTATTGTKYALRGIGPLTLLAVELLAATVVLFAAVIVRGYRPPSSWRLVIALGLLEPLLAYLADTYGLSRTSASNAAVLTGLEAGFVVILAVVFLGERTDRRLGLAVFAGLLGLFALEHNSWLTGPGVGDALVLCGALSAAVYTIVAQRIDADADPLTITAHQFAVATLAILPVAIISWTSGNEMVPTHVPARFWVVAVLVGIGGFATSFVLFNFAVATAQLATVAVSVNLIPAFGFASAVLLLGERVTPARLAGAVLITVSVAMFMATKPAAAPKADPLPYPGLHEVPLVLVPPPQQAQRVTSPAHDRAVEATVVDPRPVLATMVGPRENPMAVMPSRRTGLNICESDV